MCARGRFRPCSRARAVRLRRDHHGDRQAHARRADQDDRFDLPGAGHNAGPNRAGRGAQQLGPAAAGHRPAVRAALAQRGYRLVDDPHDAHLCRRTSSRWATSKAAAGAFAKGFGSAWSAARPAPASAAPRARPRRSSPARWPARPPRRSPIVRPGRHLQHHHRRADLGARAEGVMVTERMTQDLAQGRSGQRVLSATEVHDWKRYQTRVLSSANRVNLDFEDAAPDLVAGLTRRSPGSSEPLRSTRDQGRGDRRSSASRTLKVRHAAGVHGLGHDALSAQGLPQICRRLAECGAAPEHQDVDRGRCRVIGARLSRVTASRSRTGHGRVRSGRTRTEPSCRTPAMVKPPSRWAWMNCRPFRSDARELHRHLPDACGPASNPAGAPPTPARRSGTAISSGSGWPAQRSRGGGSDAPGPASRCKLSSKCRSSRPRSWRS